MCAEPQVETTGNCLLRLLVRRYTMAEYCKVQTGVGPHCKWGATRTVLAAAWTQRQQAQGEGALADEELAVLRCIVAALQAQLLVWEAVRLEVAALAGG